MLKKILPFILLFAAILGTSAIVATLTLNPGDTISVTGNKCRPQIRTKVNVGVVSCATFTPTKTPAIPTSTSTATAVPTATNTPAPTSNLISVNGGNFYLFGADYPWLNYGNDFGSNSFGTFGFSTNTQYNTDFSTMASKGIHVTRLWVFADARAGIVFDSNGMPTGIQQQTLTDMDAAIADARAHNIYLIPVLFDFTVLNNATFSGSVQMGGHSDMFTDATKRSALINNVLTPLIQRYKNEPSIIAWDMMNEPEFGISDLPQASVNNGLTPITMSQFWSYASQVSSIAHTNGERVTVGSATLKWNKVWTNTFAVKKGLPSLNLDFYQTHYYPWMDGITITNDPDLGTTSLSPLTQPVAALGLDHPIIVGEAPDSANVRNTILANGYAGFLAWSFNSGKTGDHLSLASDFNSWEVSHASLVRIPPIGSIDTPTNTPIPTPTNTPSSTSIPTPINTTTPTPTVINSSGACSFRTVANPVVAFCDSFDAPSSVGNDRTGDLNSIAWGASRNTGSVNFGQGQFSLWPSSNSSLCDTSTRHTPNDIQICNGMLVDTINDNGGQPIFSMYPKQPFDFSGRTGTVVFDVGDDTEGIHAAWPAFALTSLPFPAPYTLLSGTNSYAANSFGLVFNQPCDPGSPCHSAPNCPSSVVNGKTVGQAYMTVNYVLINLSIDEVGCVAAPTPQQISAGILNHFEIKISLNHVDVYGSDPGSSTLRLIASVSNFTMPFTKGFVWIEDAHYNACKFNDQCVHSFAWDNVGFDGPILPRDLGFSVPDAGNTNLGYDVSPSVTVHTLGSINANDIANASGAVVTLTEFPPCCSKSPDLGVSVNGNPTIAIPFPIAGLNGPGLAVTIPLNYIHIGSNTLTFTTSTETSILNVDIKLLGAGGVHSCVNPSRC